MKIYMLKSALTTPCCIPSPTPAPIQADALEKLPNNTSWPRRVIDRLSRFTAPEASPMPC